jgi:hypothetical protein
VNRRLQRWAVAVVLTVAGALPITAIATSPSVAAAAGWGGHSSGRGILVLLAALYLPVVLSAALGAPAFAVSRTRAVVVATAVTFGTLLAGLLAVAAAAATCTNAGLSDIGRAHPMLGAGAVVYGLTSVALGGNPDWLRRWWPLAVALGATAAIARALIAHPCVVGT